MHTYMCIHIYIYMLYTYQSFILFPLYPFCVNIAEAGSATPWESHESGRLAATTGLAQPFRSAKRHFRCPNETETLENL